MFFKEHEILDLVKQNGYPLYVYDPDVIQKKITEIKKLTGFSFLYSMKCNPNLEIVKLMAASGIGVDAASLGEVLKARSAQVPPENILYSTPGKRLCEIQSAIGQCLIIADSLHELTLINQAAASRSCGEKLKVGLRLNPLNESINGNANEVMSGGSSKFGIDAELLYENLAFIKALENIEITAVHIYFGSQILEEEIILNNVRIIAKTVLALQEHFPIRTVDFGGGFGVKIEESEKDFSMERLQQLLNGCEELIALKNQKVRLLFESGRFLVSEAGVYVSEIVDIKVSRGEKYLIVYGGMNGFFRPSFMQTRHKIHCVKKNTPAQVEWETVHVAGNLCTPIDMFAKNVVLQKAEIGDYIVIENAGAYGFTMSLTDFISHDKPKEIFVNRDGMGVN